MKVVHKLRLLSEYFRLEKSCSHLEFIQSILPTMPLKDLLRMATNRRYDYDIRETACRVLVYCYQPEAVQALLKATKDTNDSVVLAACESLAILSTAHDKVVFSPQMRKNVVNVLIKAADHLNASVYRVAIMALVNFYQEKKAFDAIIAHFNDPPVVRVDVCVALGNLVKLTFKSEKCLSLLIQALGDEDKPVQNEACQVLKSLMAANEICREKTSAALIKAGYSNNAQIRKLSMEILFSGEMGKSILKKELLK